MAKWQLQHAKARFSEFVDDAVEKGPQIVTRRGVDTAVVLKEVLLGPGPRFDISIPPRGRGRSCKPPVFDETDFCSTPMLSLNCGGSALMVPYWNG